MEAAERDGRVMRMLHRETDAAFRTALRRYLADHAFGNAGWPELVAALDEVTPLDVPAWSRVWIEEPGRPTLRVELDDGVVSGIAQSDSRRRGLLWEQLLMVKLRVAREAGANSWVGVGVRTDAPRVEVSHRFAPGSRPAGMLVLPNGAGLGYGLFVLDPGTTAFLLDSLPALQEVLGDLTTLYWRYLRGAERSRIAPVLERELWRRLEAVEGTSLIDEHPGYPPRLLGKLLQEADPLFRAVRLKGQSGGG